MSVALPALQDKITTLGGMAIPDFLMGAKKNDFDIASYEAESGLSFPEEYKWFSLKYGFHSFEEDVLFYSKEILTVSDDHYCSLGMFYGWGNGEYALNKLNSELTDQLPGDLFVIAEGAAGDYICIGSKGKRLGKIMYWHHEALENEELFLVADSFGEFIMGIKKDDVSKDEDSGLVDEWFADDF